MDSSRITSTLWHHRRGLFRYHRSAEDSYAAPGRRSAGVHARGQERRRRFPHGETRQLPELPMIVGSAAGWLAESACSAWTAVDWQELSRDGRAVHAGA